MTWEPIGGLSDSTTFEGFYYTNSVVSGPRFDSQGSGQAAFLQIKSENSPSILQIKSGTPPLKIQFANGKDGAGQTQSQLIELASTLEIDLSGKSAGTYQVWADYSTGSLSFKFEKPVQTYRQFEQPSNPSTGDTWLDMEANIHKKWNGTSWVEEKKALLGRVGLGTDGQIYTTTALPLVPELEQEMKIYVNYDGVIFATNGQYLTENASNWVDTQTVVEDVIASSLALDAVTSDSSAMGAVASSSTAMDAVASSSTAMDAVASSSTAMTVLAGDKSAMNKIFHSSNLQKIWDDQKTSAGTTAINFNLSQDRIYLKSDLPGAAGDTSSASVELTKKVDLTGKSTLYVDWHLDTYEENDYDEWAAGEVWVGGTRLVRVKSDEDKTRTVDVSGFSGEKKIRVVSKTYVGGTGYSASSEVWLYNIYLK